MPAIKPHTTETIDQSWDGPASEARLKTDQSESYYRKAYAWQDPDGDAETKAAYKFIHHQVDGDGNIGAANVRACITGIAVLNGARGGTNIPDADRQGVYNHLARHLRDADVEAPALRSRKGEEIERRTFGFEVRETDGGRRLVGHAAVFDTLSEELGFGFREIIRPGAFRKTINDGADVRALWNHNTDYVLGRTKSGTLQLEEDDVGLRVRIEPPDAQWARDLMASIERGDVDQMSFAFQAINDVWRREGDEEIREVLEVKLFDVSPVTFPAYPETDIALRSLQTASAKCGSDVRNLIRVLCSGIPGELADYDQEIVRDWLERLSSYLPDESGKALARQRRLELVGRKRLTKSQL